MPACVQMDRPLGMRAFIPRRGGRGQGSKPQQTRLPDVPGPRVRSSCGWLHYAVCAIKAAAGMAGMRWSAGLLVCFVSQADGVCRM